MAKYSVSSSTGTETSGTECELCGQNAASLTEAEISGATLSVCDICFPHDDTDTQPNSESRDESVPPRNSVTPQDTTDKATDSSSPLWNGNQDIYATKGITHTDNQLPQLVSEYSSIVQDAREKQGLTEEELALKIGVDEMTVIAIEQGSAVSESVGSEVITAVEQTLNVTLRKES